jgi:hypothetical protein
VWGFEARRVSARRRRSCYEVRELNAIWRQGADRLDFISLVRRADHDVDARLQDARVREIVPEPTDDLDAQSVRGRVDGAAVLAALVE